MSCDMSSLCIIAICQTHMSTQIKSRLQRWGNKKAMMACLDDLHQWVRSGDVTTRLKAVRELHVDPFVMNVGPSGETLTHAELVTQSRTKVIEFLLQFAAGKVKEGEVNNTKDPITQRQKPYGREACSSARGFKNLSPACLAITMASAYPLIVAEMDQWEDVLDKNIAYPVTSLWPTKVVKRHLHFNTTFFDKLEDVFESYEAADGKYFPEGEDEQEAGGEVAEPSSSDCDDVF